MNIEFCEVVGKQGINAFIGKNGQGKSAIFEATAFVMFGRKKGESFKDYVRIGEKTARVQLEWLIGTDSCFFDYEISRSSGSVARSLQYGGVTYTGTDDCQKFISEHFDIKMLQDIIFNLQDSEPITTMTPGARRDVLRKVFNVDFTQGVAALKKDYDEADSQLKVAIATKTVLAEKQYPLSALVDNLDEVNYPTYLAQKVTITERLSAVTRLADTKKVVDMKADTIAQVTQQIVSNQLTQDATTSLILQAVDNRVAQDAAIKELNQAIVAHETTISTLESKLHSLPRDAMTEVSSKITELSAEKLSGQTKISSIQSNIDTLSSEILTIDRTTESYKASQAELDAIRALKEPELTALLSNPLLPTSREEVAKIVESYDTAKADYTLVTKQLDMSRRGLCDACGQTCPSTHTSILEQSHKDSKAKYDSLALALQKEQDHAQACLSYTEAVKNLEDEIRRLVVNIDNYQTHISTGVASIAEKTVLVTTLSTDKVALEAKLEKDTLALESAKAASRDLLVQDAENKEVEADIQRFKNDISLCKEKITSCEALKARYEAEGASANTTLATLQASKQTLELQKVVLETEYSTLLKEYMDNAAGAEDLTTLEALKLDVETKLKAIDDIKVTNTERTRLNLLLTQQQDLDKKEIQNLAIAEQQYMDICTSLKQVKTILETVLPDYIIAQACVILQNFINEFIQSTELDLKVKLVAESSSKKSKGVQFYYLSHLGTKDLPEWLPVSMASGYETTLLTLAFKLAIAFMYESDILLLDEPDKTATEDNSLLLFKHIANLEGFKQIFLISHRESCLEWIKNEADALVYWVEEGTYEEVV